MTEFEEEVYTFLKKRGEVLTSNIPSRMKGAVPNLKRKGLVEVFRRNITPWTDKKRKFIRVLEK